MGVFNGKSQFATKEESAEKIKVYINDIQGNSSEFEVNPNYPISTLNTLFRQDKKVSNNYLIELYKEGNLIDEKQTFKALGIQNEDNFHVKLKKSKGTCLIV